MPSINVVGLGTLYTVQAGKLYNVPHFSEMQTLAWLAKANRPAGQRKTGLVAHTHHPAGQRSLSTPQEAYVYAAEIVEHNWHELAKSMGVDPRKVCFVPLPASNITATANGAQERWPARAFVHELARRQVGQWCPALVNTVARPEQATNRTPRTDAHEIAATTCVAWRPLQDRHVVLVDDIVTWGRRLAASHHSLRWTNPVGSLCIAFTNDATVDADCYELKRRTVTYDASTVPWAVSIAPA